MSDEKTYCWSLNGETFHGVCESRELALACAREEEKEQAEDEERPVGSVWTGVSDPVDPSAWLKPTKTFIQEANGWLFEEVFSEPDCDMITPNAEQKQDLADRLAQLWRDWVKENGIQCSWGNVSGWVEHPPEGGEADGR